MEKNGKVIDVIRGQIENASMGALFFNNSFPEYDDEYVGKVLADLTRQKVLHRLSRGVYLKAQQTKFGLVYPTTEEIAKAIAERDNAEVLPTGSAALNMLGLSTQVPMNPVYLTSGSARKIKCGNKTISFKHGVPKNFAVRGQTTRLLVQAMKAIGERNLTDDYLNGIATILYKYPETDTMGHDLTVMPSWIKRTLLKIIKENHHEKVAES